MKIESPVELCRFDKSYLTVVIDVEEEFDWQKRFSVRNQNITRDGNLTEAQSIFDAKGIVPAYLLDMPAAQSSLMSECLMDWLAKGRCEVGAQLHTWVTPPHEEVVCLANTYQRNLDRDLEQRKIETITKSLKKTFGNSPTIFKAGRYGISARTIPMLLDYGYEVDTSVVPYTDFSHFGGGADFTGFPDQPFWLVKEKSLFELPMTKAVLGLARNLRNTSATKLFDSIVSNRLSVPGFLSLLGILERIALSPESTESADILRAVRKSFMRPSTVCTIFFHSSSLILGGNQYVESKENLEAFFDRLNTVLTVMIDDFGFTPISVSALRNIAISRTQA